MRVRKKKEKTRASEMDGREKQTKNRRNNEETERWSKKEKEGREKLS